MAEHAFSESQRRLIAALAADNEDALVDADPRTLSALADRGLLERDEDGTYVLTPGGRAAVTTYAEGHRPRKKPAKAKPPQAKSAPAATNGKPATVVAKRPAADAYHERLREVALKFFQRELGL